MKNEIQNLIKKMSRSGWKETFLSLTYDQINIDQDNWQDLINKLLEPIIEIDFSHEGLLDFSRSGNKMITPYSFSKSLIYHCISHPLFTDDRITEYLDETEIEIFENLIFASVYFDEQKSLNNLIETYGDKLSVGIFSYQYCPVERSCHFKNADMNYSRTGISRIGTSNSVFDKKKRSWIASGNENNINAMPAKYGTFLCLKAKAIEINEFSIMDELRDDGEREFLVPIHKLFNGKECLSDIEIQLEYETFHRNEKLARVHDSTLENTIPIEGFDLLKFPFIIDNKTAPEFLNTTRITNSNCIVFPTPSPLSEPAIQENKYVAFNVPAQTNSNRFNSSYNIPPKRVGNLAARQSPEYVNIRNIISSENVINPEDDITNINDLPKADFEALLRNGDYTAIDFIDRTCDGFISAKSNLELNHYSAYSLITAPDYFPFVNQREVYQIEQQIDKFAQGGAIPLSDGRIKANINYNTFEGDLNTLTAVISDSQNSQENNLERDGIYQASFLPDGASSIYHPGWDISMDINEETGEGFNAAYGLGSPFPEDAKLCAALNSYWPAAAPDASRTFFRSNTFQNFGKKPTAIPMTDFELGIHPKMATQLGMESNIGWDGEYGPFFEKINSEDYVNYCDIARSDYTYSFWRGKASFNSMDSITSKELIQRMMSLKKMHK